MYTILTVWKDSGAIQQSNSSTEIRLQSTRKYVKNSKVKALSLPHHDNEPVLKSLLMCVDPLTKV